MKSPYGLPADCHSCHLQPENFFCALSREAIGHLDQIKHATVFPDGAVIFTEGQVPRGIFMLCQGQAKLSAMSSDGKTFIVRMVKPGQVLGLHEVIASNPYELTAETTEPSQLSFVSREGFVHFLREHSDALLHTAQHISRDCQEAYEVARTLGLSHSASRRIAKFLLTSATDGKVKNGVVCVKLAMTHEEIAQVIGTSRETITSTLAKFRKRNIAKLKGATLIIHDKTALERLAAA